METAGLSAMQPYPDLTGQRVFITGAVRGPGRSVAEKLASCGAAVAVSDRNSVC
jgi:NAD(P)-dependent dehydrogenase (short-subunit alcohol dehydrogenase family)